MKTVSAPFIMLVFYSLITKFLNYWLVIQALSHCVDRAYFTDWQVCLVKGMVFPVVVYGCKSWTMKKAEGRRIDAFELWCWRRLESCLDYKEIKSVNPKVLNIHWKDWSWSWNSNTLTTLCEELTHLKSPWCWARLKAGGEGNNRGWDGWMASSTQ